MAENMAGGPAQVLSVALGRRVRLDSSVAAESVVAVSPDELAPAAAALIAAGGHHAMLVAFEKPGRASGRASKARESKARPAVEEVVWLPNGPIVRLRAELGSGALADTAAPRYPSLTPAIPAAQWDEREAHDVYGIVAAGHPDPRPLLDNANAKPFVAHGDGVYQLPVGPIHAGIIEPGHFRFSAVGEMVVHLDARLFYTHRGIERLVEGRTFAEALPAVERACGVCTVTHATAFSLAVERLTGTEILASARLARVLLAEMERLYNHVGDLGNLCAGVGFNFGTSRLGWLKERLVRLNEGLTGHRYLTGMVVPGGLRRPLDPNALAALSAAVHEIDAEVRSVVRFLVRSEGFMNRLHGTGVLTREAALRFGVVGVAARASGVAADLRRDLPYGAYPELQVDVAFASSGDVAARFHVRAMEISASVALVTETAATLATMAAAHAMALPNVPLVREPKPGDSTVVGVEGPRGASWLWLMAGPGGRVAGVHLRSASFANWPAVPSVVPGNVVPDFPLINKSFELCYACTDR